MKITNEGIAVIESDSRHISKWVEDLGRLDIQEGQILPWLKNVPHGGICIDVGAFIGDTALTLSKHVGSNGIVLAIEPNPEAFECLNYNMVHSEIMSANVVTENKAIGPDDGGPCILMKDTNAGASWLSRGGIGDFHATPLDKIVAAEFHNHEKIDFIKLDVEGWEVDVLRSAQQTLERDKPDLLIEVNHGALERQGATMKDITDILLAHGYRWEITDPSIKETDPQFDIFCTTR